MGSPKIVSRVIQAILSSPLPPAGGIQKKIPPSPPSLPQAESLLSCVPHSSSARHGSRSKQAPPAGQGRQAKILSVSTEKARSFRFRSTMSCRPCQTAGRCGWGGDASPLRQEAGAHHGTRHSSQGSNFPCNKFPTLGVKRQACSCHSFGRQAAHHKQAANASHTNHLVFLHSLLFTTPQPQPLVYFQIKSPSQRERSPNKHSASLLTGGCAVSKTHNPSNTSINKFFKVLVFPITRSSGGRAEGSRMAPEMSPEQVLTDDLPHHPLNVLCPLCFCFSASQSV